MLKSRVFGLFLALAVATALFVPGVQAQQAIGNGASIEAGSAVTLIADTKTKQTKIKKSALPKCYHEPICQVCCYDSFGQPKGCKFDVKWCGM